MKRLLVVAIATGALLVPGTGTAGNGYGRTIQDCFGTSYGQAKNAAWEAGHADQPALGARLTAIAHGCTG